MPISCNLFDHFYIPLLRLRVRTPSHRKPFVQSFILGSPLFRSVFCPIAEGRETPRFAPLGARSVCILCAIGQDTEPITPRSTVLSYSHLCFARSYSASAFVVII